MQPAIDCILGESRQISSPAKVLLDEVLRQLFQSSHSRLYKAADESQQAEAPDDELQAASQGDAEPAEADADPEPENQTGGERGRWRRWRVRAARNLGLCLGCVLAV